MAQVIQTPIGAILTDDESRTLGVSVTKDGEVMFTIPSGKPGRVIRVAQVDREDAREFARTILRALGVDDQ